MNLSVFPARFSWIFIRLFLTCQQMDLWEQALTSKSISIKALSILLKVSQTRNSSSWISRLCFLLPVRTNGFPLKNLSPLKNLATPPKRVPESATTPARIIAATLMFAKFLFWLLLKLFFVGTERNGTAISMSIWGKNKIKMDSKQISNDFVPLNCHPEYQIQ